MKDREKNKEEILDEISGIFSGEIDVDAAWNKLHGRITANSQESSATFSIVNRNRIIFRIAAAILLLTGIGTAILWYISSQGTRNYVTVSAESGIRNLEVPLPDGSTAWLNRNSQLSYSPEYGRTGRNVKLRGEAFFDIKSDSSSPFVIDAGKASIKVIGTSFNVITSNEKDEVEVFVQSGKVILSGLSEKESMLIEPGFIGRSGTGIAVKSLNENRNYLSWKTDTLIFDRQPLDIVFTDLKKVFNIDIKTDDPGIAGMSLSTTFFNLPHDTIIQLICNTFTLSYRKEGSVYHLSK